MTVMLVDCMKFARFVGLFAFTALTVSACNMTQGSGVEDTTSIFSETSKEVQPSTASSEPDEVEKNILAITFYSAAGPSFGYYYAISEDNILHCYVAEWEMPKWNMPNREWSYYALDPDKFLESVYEEGQKLLTLEQLEEILNMADEISLRKKQSRIPGDDSIGACLFYSGKTYEGDYNEDKMLRKLINYVIELSPLKEESDPEFYLFYD